MLDEPVMQLRAATISVFTCQSVCPHENLDFTTWICVKLILRIITKICRHTKILVKNCAKIGISRENLRKFIVLVLTVTNVILVTKVTNLPIDERQ